MRKAVILLLLVPQILHAQLLVSSSGIVFENGLNWEQTKAKAKAENKYIFVDCQATWCGPCKWMEKEVYSNEQVGEIVNKNFISVKVQMDTTASDNEYIKQWYGTAHSLLTSYKVSALPTYLFFSPQGEIVHREVGIKQLQDFLGVIRAALTPGEQVYTALRNYRRGKKDFKKLMMLANAARTIDERKLADSIARDYINNYLFKMHKDRLFEKENIEFIVSFMDGVSAPAFPFFYNNRKKIDSVMNHIRYSEQVIDFAITKEYITPNLKKATAKAAVPNWTNLFNIVQKKFNRIDAERIILNAKIRFYTYNKVWREAVKYNVQKIDRYGLDTLGINKYFLNNMIWDVIFLHSNDRGVLTKALAWSKIIVDADPSEPVSLDTYANLLYKVGRVEEAIKWEEKANELEKRRTSNPNKIYEETAAKMLKGEATWDIKSN